VTEYEELDTQLRAWLAEDRQLAEDAEYAFMYFDTDDDSAVAYYRGQDPTRVLAEIAGKLALLDHLAGWPHVLADGDTWFSCSQAESPNVSGDFAGPGSGCADDKRKGKPCDCGLDGRRLAVLRCVAAGYVERAAFKDAWRIDDSAQNEGRPRVRRHVG
jgi:hypothetical protein